VSITTHRAVYLKATLSGPLTTILAKVPSSGPPRGKKGRRPRPDGHRPIRALEARVWPPKERHSGGPPRLHVYIMRAAPFNPCVRITLIRAIKRPQTPNHGPPVALVSHWYG
jgi:hypothetical protein